VSSLTASHLEKKNLGGLYVMNRTQGKAVSLANRFAGTALSFWQIEETLKEVDVCICSASAPHFIIEKDLIESVMRKRAHRTLILIDISMPRNIHPDVFFIPDVLLWTIDDLDKVIEENLSGRRQAIKEVEMIIVKKMDEFYEKLSKRKIGEGFNETLCETVNTHMP
jgi:glutamyl-tRNA reductase